MSQAYKSKKFHGFNPFIPVRNLKQTLEFYRDRLGFHDEWMWNDLDGGIERDDLRLMFSEEPVFFETPVNNDFHSTLMWFVDNVDEIYEEYKCRHIPILGNLENKPWGTREFIFSDPNGYIIRVAEGIKKNHKNSK